VGVVPSRPWVSCHLILSTVFSGAEKVVVDELNTLDRGRFAPSLVCTEENAGAFRRRLKGDVRVVPIRSGKQGWARDPGLTLRVRRALREVSPRVLCCHNNSAWNLGLLLRPWLGWPGILATEHINLSGLGGQGVGAARSQKFQLYLWALRGLLRGRVRFVAVSSAVQEYLQSVYEIPDERISILENGIDTDDYPYSFRSRDDLRERLGMAPEEPLAVVVGRFDTQKGYIYFQEALRDLVARQPMLRVVYVGDHIYGDIVRSKKSSAWRTVMIVQEMESELKKSDELRDELARLDAIDAEVFRLSERITFDQTLAYRIDDMIAVGNGHDIDQLKTARRELIKNRDQLRRRRKELLAELDEAEVGHESRFNPYWGLIFRLANENTLFGEQVEDYACLYTSHVSNFLNYSPLHYFRAPRQLMPHERY